MDHCLHYSAISWKTRYFPLIDHPKCNIQSDDFRFSLVSSTNPAKNIINWYGTDGMGMNILFLSRHILCNNNYILNWNAQISNENVRISNKAVDLYIFHWNLPCSNSMPLHINRCKDIFKIEILVWHTSNKKIAIAVEFVSHHVICEICPEMVLVEFRYIVIASTVFTHST